MSEKNSRPEEASSFPYIAIFIIILMIAGLLYAGYESFSDTTADTNELMDTPLDTTGKDLQPKLQSINDKVAATDTMATDLTAPITSGDTPTTTDNKEKSTTDEATDVATDTKKPESAPALPKNLGGEENTHTVQAGETFFGIANRYNLKWSTLKALNPDVTDESVKSGVTTLNIRVQAVHTVGAGDILRVVAEKYGITVAQLMAANKKTKNRAERGEQLIIPFATKK